MRQLESYDLHPDPEDEKEEVESIPSPFEPREERSFGLVLLMGVLVLVAGTGGYLFYRARQAPAPAPVTTMPMQRATPAPIPEPEAVGLPALGQSDAFVRDLLKGLSTHPQLGLWLAQEGLVRSFVNVVETVTKGESPRASLGFLAPKGPFVVAHRKGREVIDAKSFARYDPFAEGVASLDAAAGAAALKRGLPLLEAAYRELGYPQGGFEKALREGIAHLLEVPVVRGDVTVKPVRRGNVLVHEYTDSKLEGLSAAQKHLLRMGPANVERIQGTLRAFDTALGS